MTWFCPIVGREEEEEEEEVTRMEAERRRPEGAGREDGVVWRDGEGGEKGERRGRDGEGEEKGEGEKGERWKGERYEWMNDFMGH